MSSQSLKNLSGPVGRNTAQAPGQSKNKRCKTPIGQYRIISAKHRGSATEACARSRCFNCAVLPHTTRFQQELRARIFAFGQNRGQGSDLSGFSISMDCENGTIVLFFVDINNDMV